MEGLTAILFSICILAVLLLIGKVMRVKIKLFQRIFLPSSIIGGFIGLAVGPFGLDLIPEFILGTWGEIPGVLINIVFATLFLGVAIPGIKKVWSMGGSQLCFGAVIGTGQYFVALLVTALVLTPFFGVNHEFGTILEIGFSGGHGTAAGMTSVFEAVGFPEGTALAYMSATVGIIVAVVGGIIFINIAIRKDQCVNFDKNESIPEYKKKGLIKEQSDRYSNSEATVASESIEPLAFHFSVVAVAVLIGWGLLHFVRKAHPQLEGFPLFPLAMIGGMIIQIISKPLKLTTYYDKNTFDRILGISLDFLVVAAISTLRLDLFLENVWPFLILMAVGIAWIMFCLVFLAPKMFPNNWFERGITEYGMQTGVTAIGLLLLRLVDPHYKTDTAQSFGFKQIIYEPFLGGGFITATIPFIVFSKGIWWSIIVAGSLAVFFFLLSWLNGWVNLRRRAWRN
jgi:ESS family glutamate:Na+ symporter